MVNINLKNQTQFFEAIVETASDVILTVDDRGRIETCNRAAIEMIGYSPDDLIGGTLGIFMLDQYFREYEKVLQLHLAGEESNFLGVGKRIEAKKKDGTIIPVSFTVSEIGFKNQRYFSAVFRDITKIMDTEKELEKVGRELALSNSHLEEFASLAAHDLQAPLRTVAMLVSRLGRPNREESDDKSSETLQRIGGATRRMQTLISDLLVLCQIRKERKAPVRTEANLVLDGVLADLLAATSESRCLVTRSDLPCVMADEGQLRVLMQNLISNAIKFCRPGTMPEVQIMATEQPTHWEFCIADNGIGIDEKYFKKIFLPFQRLHGRSEYPGNGIGLALCKEIVERHGGTMRLESRIGVGSKFYFTISKCVQE